MANKVGRIRDVAKESGLSIATISRVMNGSKNVSPATREKVLAACRKLDYVPNPAARALTTRSTRTIAAIIPTIEHSVFAKFIAAIEQTLAEQDYSLVLAITNADPVEELRAVRKLLGMGAEAFILSGIEHSEELLHLLERRNTPNAYTSVWDPDARSATIGYDNHALAAQAVRFLASRGHRRIAIVHGLLSESDRTQARRRGADSASADVDCLDYYEVPLEVAGGKQAFAELTAAGRNYTAILCFSDVLALGCSFGAQEAGLRIPKDISLMGFDNLDWSSQMFPPLTTINLPARRMGRVVARSLVAHLETDAPITPVLLEGEIVSRASIRDLGGHES